MFFFVHEFEALSRVPFRNLMLFRKVRKYLPVNKA